VTRGLPLTAKAFAKINVTLRVLGIRPDGYHELRTVFQSLALHDRLTFTPVAAPFAIACDDPVCPTDGTNLVWRAAELVWRAARRRGPLGGVRVRIDKGIPAQAGLGGGSSDAAATLRVLGGAWCPDLNEESLAELGRTLGADVPFFLKGGTALGVARGDRLFQLADAPDAWVVLARPDFGVGTADAYRWYDDAAAAAPLHDSWHPPAAGGPYGDGGNDLQAAVALRHPTIGRLVRAFERRGAFWAAMSGSGSVCFGLFETERAARRAAAAIRTSRITTLVTRTQTAAEYRRAARPTRPGR
jgi:4-diphosphocytidyl-2-C-methyl-D-erythritol kinase